MDIERRLSKAKTALVLEHPFVGNVAMNMPFKFSEAVPTAATDGERVLFNLDFCESLNDEELKFLVAHECMHPMLEHNFRRNGRDAIKWNCAIDYVVNKLLVDEKIGKMIDDVLLSDDIYAAGGGTSDGIYNILPEMHDDSREPLDDCRDCEGTAAEIAQQAAEWKIRVTQAAQAARMMGKLSAGMERLVSEILQPKVNWADVLRRFVARQRTNERSFTRPNRRFIRQGMYLPGVTGETLGELVFCVDCSGSIEQKEIDQYAAEITKVQQDHHPEKVHIIYFDSEVKRHDEFVRGDTPEIKPRGGGGTAFSPVFKFIGDKQISPIACVFLTDLCCGDFGDAPDYHVLWVSTGGNAAPFGEIVAMKI